MLKSHKIVVFLLILGLFLNSCNSTKNSLSNSLKTKFNDDFLIGAALNADQINQKDPLVHQLILNQFNTLTPENVMKCEIIHPHWDKYDFSMSDKLVDYANKHKISVIGHTLVWHSQLSPFVSKIIKTDSFKLFFENHIITIASRYNDKIKGWDVVNEALNEDGTIRQSIFLEKLGEGYIVDAFKLADKAAPKCELYYNDYNIEQPLKRKGVVSMVNKLRENGARIDGIGIQGHWSINGPPLADLEAAIIEFSNLGLKVMLTELDLTALPNPWDLVGADINQNFEGDPKMDPYRGDLPDTLQVKLATGYSDLFTLLLKHRDKIDRVTFWGVNDGQSWLNDWPIKGRVNYPLLFDRANKPKHAYKQIMGLKYP
jgi:endo-1,4-beta-xylanase